MSDKRNYLECGDDYLNCADDGDMQIDPYIPPYQPPRKDNWLAELLYKLITFFNRLFSRRY